MSLLLTGVGNALDAPPIVLSTATFDPARKLSPGITLSNGNKTATRDTADGKAVVYMTVDIPANKRIPVEVIWTTMLGNDFSPVGAGITYSGSSPTLAFNDDGSDQGSNHGVVMLFSGQSLSGVTGGRNPNIDTKDAPVLWAQGDTELFLIDTYVNKLWMAGANGVWHGDATTGATNDPTTNSGGLSFNGIATPFTFSIRLFKNGDVCTVNPGSSAFVRAAQIPANYTDRL